jgi:hypothetical protein
MKPLQVLSAPKSIGLLKADKEFSTLPFKIQDKPIVMEFEGTPNREFQLSQFNNKKLQLALDVSQNGELQFVATSLVKILQEHLDDATLPEVTAVVRNFIKNERVYLTWPYGSKGYDSVETDIGTVCPSDQEVFESLQTVLGQKWDKGVVILAELLVWVKKENDNNLSVGVSPRIKEMHFK